MEWVGRLHPLVLHLPIGILLLAVLFEWLILFQPFKKLEASLPIMLLLGSIAAWLSCLTGYLLSRQGDYAGMVEWHKWISILVACIATAYWLLRDRISNDLAKMFSLVVAISIGITGHIGGMLTHGEDFLFASRDAQPVIDINNAYFYADVVKPVLEKKCVSCHGANKQKGKLRLDEPKFIQAGGKHGAVLVINQPDASELIKRLLLPIDHEDHMPPAEKAQLSKEEIDLLQNWIATGASFDKKYSAVNKNGIQPAKIVEDEIPNVSVAPASIDAIGKLQQLGATVTPLSSQSNFLQVTLTNATLSDTLFQNLLQIKEQIVWLKADNKKMENVHLKEIKHFGNLKKLWLSSASIDDQGLFYFRNPGIRYINLSNTNVTLKGIDAMLKNSTPNRLIVFGTSLSDKELRDLRKMHSDILIEGGRYSIPTFQTDTQLVTPPK